MGLIGVILETLFGDGRNAIADTARVFREDAEREADRAARLQGQALAQFGQEFALPRRSVFDTAMDAINRVPRPALALGTLGLFVAAMVDPVWFGARMQGLSLVPEPLWWLLGVIVSFYFGARHQAKGQAFRAELARTMAAVPQVVEAQRRAEALRTETANEAADALDANPALDDWATARRGGATM